MQILAQIRQFFKLPQSDMALLLKVSRSRLSMAEGNHRHINYSETDLIIKLWNVMTDATASVHAREDASKFQPGPGLVKKLEDDIQYFLLISRRKLKTLHEKIDREMAREAAMQLLMNQEFSADEKLLLGIGNLPHNGIAELKEEAFKEEMNLRALELKMEMVKELGREVPGYSS